MNVFKCEKYGSVVVAFNRGHACKLLGKILEERGVSLDRKDKVEKIDLEKAGIAMIFSEDETPLIKRLEALASYVESMFKYPNVYATTARGLEQSILTAINCWAMIIDSPHEVNSLWREEVKKAHPNAGGYATISLSTPDSGAIQDESLYEAKPRIIKHMREVWHKVKYE